MGTDGFSSILDVDKGAYACDGPRQGAFQSWLMPIHGEAIVFSFDSQARLTITHSDDFLTIFIKIDFDGHLALSIPINRWVLMDFDK